MRKIEGKQKVVYGGKYDLAKSLVGRLGQEVKIEIVDREDDYVYIVETPSYDYYIDALYNVLQLYHVHYGFPFVKDIISDVVTKRVYLRIYFRKNTTEVQRWKAVYFVLTFVCLMQSLYEQEEFERFQSIEVI